MLVFYTFLVQNPVKFYNTRSNEMPTWKLRHYFNIANSTTPRDPYEVIQAMTLITIMLYFTIMRSRTSLLFQ